MTAQPEKPSIRVPQWLYRLLLFWLRAAYHFRIEGAEYLPATGPLILLPTDIQGFLGPIAQMFGLVPVMNIIAKNQVRFVSIMHEQLYAVLMRKMSTRQSAMYGVRSHTAGTQALSLIDAYRALKEGGLVNINPEGDQSWDGAGVGIRDGGAWLALRTAAPCVLVVPTAGLYDVWPFWERFPSLRGRVTLKYSMPFTLADAPLGRVTDEDLARAKAVIGAKLQGLRFGAGGRAEWAPPPRLGGQVLAELPALSRTVPTKEHFRRVPAPKQGIGLLLFQCPICGTTDSIVHRRGLGRRNRVLCRACGAVWHVHREYSRDLRLVLKRGPADLIGLDVALSELHDYVKSHLTLRASPVAPQVSLLSGETVLLIADKCKLIPYDKSVLAQGIGDGLAPETRADDHIGALSMTPLGDGQLIMTDRRMLWRRDGHAIAFDWAKVTALHLFYNNRLVVAHGAALYTIALGSEGAIKWIAYANVLLNGGGDGTRKRVPISPY